MRKELPIQFDEDIRYMMEIRDGDRGAYDHIYQRYFATVASFMARHGGRYQGCEDLTQEVFARVWRRRALYRPLGPVRNYLFGIAANVLRENRSRSHGRAGVEIDTLEDVSDTSGVSPPARAESAEQLQALCALMARLSARQREALELVYLVGLGPEDAARRLGCSVKALRVHLCKARQKLRKLARP
jgi:RNA polymerase sigma-70 factor (ECF subfamily)